MLALANILFVLSLLGGLIIVPLGFPGTWLMVIATFLYSLVANFQTGKSDLWVLGIATLLALLAEGVEYGIGIMVGRKFKVADGTVVASLVGGILGAIIGVPMALIGSLLGLFLGVFAGAFAYEMYKHRDWKKSLNASFGAFFSKVIALFIKTMVAFTMVIYLLVKTF